MYFEQLSSRNRHAPSYENNARVMLYRHCSNVNFMTLSRSLYIGLLNIVMMPSGQIPVQSQQNNVRATSEWLFR